MFKYLARFLVLLIPAISIQSSCNRNDEPASPLIFMNPEELQLFADVGEVISFDITSTSEAGLALFKVESKLDDGQSFTIVDYEEALSGVGNYNKLYEMQAPQSAAGQSLILTFTATDVNGLQTATLRRLWVTATAALLVETTGHVMYNTNSQNANAYNIELGLPIISQFSTDSMEKDIQDYPLDTTTTILSRTWISPAGGMFVKFNSFDYANATDSSLVQAFGAGIPLPQVDNLQELDIVLLQLEDSIPQIAVIQITSINNIDTTTNMDSYIFSIKK